MNNIQIFRNDQFGEIRVIEKDNQAWFCLADVCKILELDNPSQLKTRLKKDGLTINEVIDRIGRKQLATFINESNLYKAVFQSRKQEAEQFTEWVTSDVLPNIRKHGLYMTDNLLEKTLQDPNFLITILTKYKEEKEKNEMLLHQGKLYTATEIAKELGFRSAQELNEDLRKRGIQYKVNNTWVLTADYAEKGYTSIKQDVLENGKVIYDRKWTGLGREFLLKLYKGEEKHDSNC